MVVFGRLHALFKNIITAIATSASATFIARVSQVYQNYFVGNLSAHNHMYQIKFAALKSKFLMHYPEVLAAKKANGILYRQLLSQSRLGAFFDVFIVLATLCLLIIPIIYILKTKKSAKT